MAKARLLDMLVLHIIPLSQVLVRVDGPQVVEAVVAALHQYLHPQEVPLVVSDCRFLLLDHHLLPQWVGLDQMEKLDGLLVVEEEMLLTTDHHMVEVKVVDLVDHMLVEETVAQHHNHRAYPEIMVSQPQEVAAVAALMEEEVTVVPVL